MQPSPTDPDEGPRLPWGPRLSQAERLTLAKLSGAVDRWCAGDLAGRPDVERDAALAAFGADGRIWGVVLGSVLRRVELGEDRYAAAVVVCRRAGADERVARMHLEWLRGQPGV